jgi:O-antigen/teichoic acid export membrane protein
MNGIELKKSTIGGIAWKLLENMGTQLINFIIQIVLARILMPEDYGVIALTGVFIVIANVFVETGFSSALIQKEDVNDIEYSSVFFAGIFISLTLYLTLFIAAPFISAFYSQPILTWVLRVQSISIILSALYSVQNAILVRNLQFKKSFKYRVLGISLQGITGISLALLGYGVWSLITANLINALVMTISLWFAVEWKPRFIFSFVKLKSLLSFSIRILLSSLTNSVFNNIKSLVIGKSFSSMALGYYNRGYQIPSLIMVNTDGALNTVIYPVLSKCQYDKERFISVYRRSIKTSFFITFPIMFGLVAIAEPLTILLLTDKWLPSVPFLRITSLICMFWPFSIMYQAFNAQGNSKVSLRLNIIIKTIEVIFMLVSIKYGIFAFVLSTLASSFIWLIIGSFVIKSVLGYKILQQLMDILPSLMLSVLMGGTVIIVGEITDIIICKLIIQIVTGALVYIGGALIFKMETLTYLIATLKEVLKGRNVITR